MQPTSIPSTDNIPEEHVQVDCEQEYEQEPLYDHDHDDHRHNQEQQKKKQQRHHIVHFDNTEPSSYPPQSRGGLLGQLHSPFMSKSSDSHQHPSDVSDQDDYSELGGSSKHKNKSKGQNKQDDLVSAQHQQSSSNQHQHQHQHQQEVQHHSNQLEQTERSRHSNGYGGTIHPDHRRSSHSARRLSSSINTNGSPSTAASSTSIPSSPSQYSLPFNHNSNNHQRTFEKEHASSSSQSNGNGTPGATYSSSRSRTRSKSHPDFPSIPLNACRSASFGCSYSMIILFLLSFTVLGCVFHSNFYHQVDADNCEPIYMQPKYFKLLGFDRERTAFAGKYGLFLFRDQYDYRLQVDPSLLTDRGNYVWTVDKEAKVNGVVLSTGAT